MAKKKGISNRLLYTLIVVGVLAILGVGVYAFNTAGPASYFGHSAGELEGVLTGTLVNNQTIASTNNYMSVNIGGTSYLIPLYVQTTLLVGGIHTAAQCTNAGGMVVTDAGGSFCKFTLESCPGGWTKYQDWSETISNTCSGTQLLSLFPFVSAVPCGGNSCTTGSHSFADLGVETCQYEQRNSDFSCPSTTTTCTAFQAKTGCV